MDPQTTPFKWPDGRWRLRLPIDPYLGQIIQSLRQHQVLVVQAETGAGKTIRIGQAITLSDTQVRVWLTQTRRPAVRWNGKRIAYEMGTVPGQLVGWNLRGEPPVRSKQTRLELVIDQSLVNTIRRLGRLPAGVLIIDEAHERQISTDLLLGLIKQYLPNSPRTQVIITSATIDTKKFSEYFDGAPVISVPGRVYPVETRTRKMAYAEHHTNEAINAASMVLQQFAIGNLTIIAPQDGEEITAALDDMRAKGASERQISESLETLMEAANRQIVTRGSVLILLPGKEDIKQVVNSLESVASQLKNASVQFEILACHGEVTSAEQDAVTADVPEGTLRIVCATEIVRSSVTVPEVVGVIDSLQVKRLIVDAKGVAHLQKIAVSRAEADQAKGRAGRTQPGFYIPVSFENEYEKLERWPQAAILREPITSVVLQVASIGLDVRTFPFIDRPAEDKIQVAITRLQKLGGLTTEEKITPMGRLLVRFPIDPERARVLITADQLGVLPEAIIAAAVLEVEQVRFKPKEKGEMVVISEQLLRKILADNAGRRYFGEGEDREWREPTPEEIDLATELPEWAVPRSNGTFEIDCGSYRFPLREGAKQLADMMWQELAGESKSDFVAAVRAYRAYKAATWRIKDEARALRDAREREIARQEQNAKGKKGKPFKPQDIDFYPGSSRWQDDQLFAWCKENNLNLKRLGLVDFTIAQLREEVENSPLRLENGIAQNRNFDAAALTKSLASGQVDNVCRKKGYLFAGPLGDEIQLGYGTACPENAELIFVGGVRKIPQKTRRGGTGFIHLVDMAAPVQSDWLLEVMPQLCNSKLRDGSAYLEKDGSVAGTRDTYYGDVLIASSPMVATGKDAAEVLAEAMLKGKTDLSAGWLAKSYISRVEQLGIREGTRHWIGDQVQTWLVDRMVAGKANTLAEARELDLFLTDDIVSDMLGFDYPEYRRRILSERPDYLTLGGRVVKAVYRGAYNRVELYVPLLLSRRITAEMLPTWEKPALQIYVDSPQYKGTYVNASEIADLPAKVEKRRLEIAWDEYQKREGRGYWGGDKIVVTYPDPLPTLPASEVYDRITGARAFPAWEYYTYESGDNASSTWKIRWCKSWTEAKSARNEAKSRKSGLDAQELERRNFDQLISEAQALFFEVEKSFEEIDWDRSAAYGLTSEEANSYREAGIRPQLNKANELSGHRHGIRYAKPTEALDLLRKLQSRIEVALTYFEENTKLQPEAEKALGIAQADQEKVLEVHRDTDLISYEQKNAVTEAVSAAVSAYQVGDYLTALAKAKDAVETAREPLKRAGAYVSSKEAFEAFLLAEYATCPVCGRDIAVQNGSWCYCPRDQQAALKAKGNFEAFVVKVSIYDGEEIVKVEAIYNDRYNEYEIRLIINDFPVPFDQEVVKTETFWRQPSAHEREVAEQLAELQRQLDAIESERTAYGRVQGIFRQTDHGLQFEGVMPDSQNVQNKRDPEGSSFYEAGTPMIFTYRKHCSWLDTQPQAGEEWISTLGFQVAQVDGKPVIVVNPQVKVDAAREADLKAQIEKLRAELTDEQELEASLAPEEVASDSLGDESMAALLELKKLLGK